jgi:hypothetical protein
MEAATAIAQSEFERLQNTGINVVSRGMTVSPANASIFTVSPWIPCLRECSEDAFRTQINPKLDWYFGVTESGGVVLEDVDTRPQYSYSPALGEHLLHDVDPDLARITKA